jgi:hypothetical protein
MLSWTANRVWWRPFQNPGNSALSHDRCVRRGLVCLDQNYSIDGCVLEAKLARLEMGEFEASDESFPMPMDMSCDNDAADIYLGRFDFA